jgi:hypothetical protein
MGAQAFEVLMANVRLIVVELEMTNVLESNHSWPAGRVVGGLEIGAEWPIGD